MNVHGDIAWGDEINGLRLGISVERDRYSPEERPIMLEIVVANVSSRTIPLVESHVLQEYEIEVLGADGRPVPMTAEGDKVRRAARTLESSRSIKPAIAPGLIHKVDWPVRLDEWFDLNAPGTYVVRVRRRDWQSDQGPLLSGPLTFVVSDRREPMKS
jgi:hypothetical protein